MNLSVQPLRALFGTVLAGVMALGLVGCETGSTSASGPAGPTVKVAFDSQPSAAIIINDRDVGVTPTTVNLEVDDKGQLIYTNRITFDFSKTVGGRNAPSNRNVDWPVGKIPPAKATFVSGNVTESREYAPANPAGTRASVERRD